MKWKIPIIKKGWLSLLVILAMGIFYLYTFLLAIDNGEDVNYLTRWDHGGYYGWLPAAVVYHDFSFSFFRDYGIDPDEFLTPLNGKPFNKYGPGIATMQFPFFMAGHLFAITQNKPANGMSAPYKFAVGFGALFYIICAFFLLRSFLLSRFSDFAVALTILSIGLGTDLYYYSTVELMLSHVYTFFLFTCIICLSRKWSERKKGGLLVLMGFLLGLVAAVRLPNIVIGIFPVLYGITSWSTFKQRLIDLWKPLWLAMALACAVVAMLPQLLYWKFEFGSWFLNPYFSEQFFFTEPLFSKILFSFRKGWFIYSPLMITSFLGFIFIRKYYRESALAVTVFAVGFIYMISSWWCWWYGGCFGMRAFIELTVPLSITIASFYEMIWMKRWRVVIVTPIVAALVAFCVFQSYQYRNGLIHWDSMTKESYRIVFLKMPPLNEADAKLYDKSLDHPDYAGCIHDAKMRRELK